VPEPSVTEEHLLGFDAREMLPAAESWTSARRSLYLLRPEVRRPLSADSEVWSSLFDDGSGIPRPGVSELLSPKWTGPNARLWEDLGRLESNLATVNVGIPYCLVAFTWLADAASLREPRSYGPYDEPMTPGVRSPEWLSLGFDVGDGGMLSGLMNCSYNAEERKGLVEEWGPWLNEAHLFADAEAAFEFRLLTNRRVAEHAPFFVYGLWLIREVRAG
jgi:hypothetical protein